MPNIMGVLRAEIRRLARKETKQEIGALRKQVAAMRRRLAESKRRMRDLERHAKQGARALSARTSALKEEAGRQVRFSPTWVRAHRKKLRMSRQLYARLVGVSAQTIMGWEAGRTRPRRSALQAWRAIRGKGIRELKAEASGGEGGRPGRPGRKGRRARTRPARRKRIRARTRPGARARTRPGARARGTRRVIRRRGTARRAAGARRVRGRAKKK